MSDDGDDEPQEPTKNFFADRAKTGRATCKKCKQKLDSGDLRLAKAGYNPFGPGPMKMWHHLSCLFDVFSRQRPTTAKIETPDDIEGWSDLEEEDQEEILKHLPNCKDWKPTPKSPSKEDKKAKPTPGKTSKEKDKTKAKKESTPPPKDLHKDDSFREFRRLCAALSDTDSYTGKTALVKEFLTKGTDGSSFKGDLNLWCRLLLPGAVKHVYNLQSKQLIKLFSRIFHTDQDDMLEDLEKGDVAETVRVFFEKSTHLQPAKKSVLYLQDVDKFLMELTSLTKEDAQSHHFKEFSKKCTSNDLKMVIRLVKHDLRINAGPKHILEAVHPDAYQAYQTSHDLDSVLSKAVVKTSDGHSSPTKKTSLKITASLLTPVLPMLPKSNEDNCEEKTDISADNEEHLDKEKKIRTNASKKRSVSVENGDEQPLVKKSRTISDDEKHRNKTNKTRSHEFSSKTDVKETDVPDNNDNTFDVPDNNDSTFDVPDNNDSTFKHNSLVTDQEEDEYTTFGNYVAEEIRSLHSEEHKRELKRIIQKAIIDIAEKDDKI